MGRGKERGLRRNKPLGTTITETEHRTYQQHAAERGLLLAEWLRQAARDAYARESGRELMLRGGRED